MAKVRQGASEKIYSIKRWLGVNEAEEGEASLKMGEAAVMRNFKVTSGGALKKRGGTKRIMELTAKYNIEEYDDVYEITEYGESRETVTLYPRVTADDKGVILLEGKGVAVTFDEAESHRSWYTDSPAFAIAASVVSF